MYQPNFYLLNKSSLNPSAVQVADWIELAEQKGTRNFKAKELIQTQRMSGLTIKEFANEMMRSLIINMRDNGKLAELAKNKKDFISGVDFALSEKMDYFWCDFQQLGDEEEIKTIESYDNNTETIFFDYERELKVLTSKDEVSIKICNDFVVFYFELDNCKKSDIADFIKTVYSSTPLMSDWFFINSIIPECCKIVWDLSEKSIFYKKEYGVVERHIYEMKLEVAAALAYPTKAIHDSVEGTVFNFNEGMWEVYCAFYTFDKYGMPHYQPIPERVSKIMDESEIDIEGLSSFVFKAGVVAWGQYYPSLNKPEEIVEDHQAMALTFMNSIIAERERNSDIEFLQAITTKLDGICPDWNEDGWRSSVWRKALHSVGIIDLTIFEKDEFTGRSYLKGFKAFKQDTVDKIGESLEDSFQSAVMDCIDRLKSTGISLDAMLEIWLQNK